MKAISCRSNLIRALLLGIAILFLITTPFFAQSDTARIVGTVMDATGAMIPAATVTAINTLTNIRTDVASMGDGSFVITPLRIGTYSLEVTAQGFRKFVRSGIVLEVNQVARIDVKLEVGSVNEVVEVTGAVPLIETDQSSLGQVINDRRIIDLPLNGRNFTQLAILIPGVTRGVPGSNADGSGGNAETFRQGETGSAAVSANGLREQNNNFQLDGIDNNESIVNTIVFFPPVEAMAEFKVITNVAPAEFGRGGGAIVNAVIKSGSNDFHGSAFEFLRNSDLDARPTFANSKPVFIRNQFGGTIGGPIKKDRTFFFADYQGLRQRLPIEAGGRVTVPTAKMRTGDFSELLNPSFTRSGNPIQIYNPMTGAPFAGNIINIPLNPVAVKYLNVFPLPDLTDRATQNFFTHRIRKQTFDDGDVRIDHKISDKDTIFGRYSIAQDRQFDPGRIPGFQAGFGAGTNQVKAHSVGTNYTRTFSPHMVNEFRFGFVKQRIEFLPVNFETDQTAALGIGGQIGLSPAERGGIVLIGGGNGNFIEYLGDGGPFKLNERTFQFSDAFTYIKGKHTLKFGATIIRRSIDSLQSDLGKGFYFFDDFTTTPGNKPAAGRTGYEIAEMLIGRTSFTTGAFVTPTTAINFENGFFAQDDWRPTRRLTLNLGLRYDVLSPPYEKNDHLANYNPISQTLVLPGKNGAPRSTVDTDWRDFGPRVGGAYSLTGDGKTVLRGGYGLFYSLDRGGIANQLTQNPPFNTQQFAFNFGDVTPGGIAAGGQLRLNDPIPAPSPVDPNAPSLPLGSKVRFIPRDNKVTRVQQYNVSIEREITSKLALDIAYVGTNGDRVTAITTQSGFGGSITGLITTIANVGDSNYNSLQIKMNMNNWHGLSFLSGYTWGKATNNAPGPFPGPNGNNQTTPTDRGGLAPGLADFDVNHRFTFAGTYNVPVYSGATGAARKFLEGWQLNSIITLQKGTPFSVFGGGNSCCRAKQVGDPNAVDRNADHWFNTAAFVQAGTQAEQSGRNILRGPGIVNLDFSVFRKFNFTERYGLEFRTEFFNIFNHPQLGFPDQSVTDGNFGRITTTRLNSERQIQFGLRFNF